MQKDPHQHTDGSSPFQSDTLGPNMRTRSFFSIPGVFVGFNNSKASPDSDAIRSPTSPLDFRIFSNLSNPFRSLRNPHNDVPQRSWDCSKVGLSIIDSLDDNRTGKVLRSSDSKTVLFGSQMRRINSPNHTFHMDSFETSNSLPINCAVFPNTYMINPSTDNSDVEFGVGQTPKLGAEAFGKIRSCSLDSGRSFLVLPDPNDRSSLSLSSETCGKNMGSMMSSGGKSIEESINVDIPDTKLSLIPFALDSGSKLIGSLAASEIELSEDYTRITSHGPNPKTTHVFGDCILQCHTKDLPNTLNDDLEIGLLGEVKSSTNSTSFPSDNFLSCCFYCEKRLDGKDIYMYRGEKAFCSLNCRSQAILTEKEKGNNDFANKSCEEPLSGIFIAI